MTTARNDLFDAWARIQLDLVDLSRTQYMIRISCPEYSASTDKAIEQVITIKQGEAAKIKTLMREMDRGNNYDD